MAYNDYLARMNGGVIQNTSDPYALQIKKLKQAQGQFDRSAAFDPTQDYSIDAGFDDSFRQNIQASRQTTGEKWANAWGKMGVLAGTTFLDATVGSVWGIGESIIEGDITKIWNNKASNLFQDINEMSEEAMPLYKSTEEEDTPWYQRMTTPGMAANFWGDTVFKNFGFTIGAIMGGAAMAGGVSKTLGNVFSKKIAGQLGSALAKNPEETAKVFAKYGAKSADDLINIAGKNPQVANNILQEINQSASIIKNINTTSSAAGLIGSAVGEGRIEAINGKETMYNDLLAAGYSPTEAERMSLASGNIQFAANVALLSLSNYAQFGKMFGFNNRSAAQALIKGNFQEAGEFAVKERSKKSLAARAFLNPVVEANEEMSQAFAEEFSHDIVLRRNDTEAIDFVDDVINSSLESFSKTYGNVDRWEEGFAGFITGAIGLPNIGGIRSKATTGKGSVWSGGIAGTIMEDAANNKQAAEYTKVLNNIKNSDTFKNYYKKAVINASYEQDKEDAKEANDNNAFEDLNTQQLISDISAAVDAGQYDSFISSLEESKTFTGEDIRAASIITKGKDGKPLAEPISPLKNKTNKELEQENVANANYLIKKAEQTRDLKEQLDTKFAYMNLENSGMLSHMMLLDGVMLEETNKKASEIATRIAKEISTMMRTKINYNPIESKKYTDSVDVLTTDDLRSIFDITVPQEILDIKDVVTRNQKIIEFLNSETELATSITKNIEKTIEEKFNDNISFAEIDKKDKKDLTPQEDLAKILRDNYIKSVNEFTSKNSSNYSTVQDLIKTESSRKRFAESYRKLNSDVKAADEKITEDNNKINNLSSVEDFKTTSEEEKIVLDSYREEFAKLGEANINKKIQLTKKTITKLEALKTSASIQKNVEQLKSMIDSMQEQKKEKKEQAKQNKTTPVLLGTSTLSEIYEKDLTEEELKLKNETVENLDYNEYRAAFVVEVTDENVEDDFADFEHPLVRIKRGNRLGKVVKVYLDLSRLPGENKSKVLLGNLLDPNRFTDRNGRVLDLSNPLVLARISDGLVEDGKLTKKGENFVDFYAGLDVAWNNLNTNGDTSGFGIKKKEGFDTKDNETVKITDRYSSEKYGIDLGFGKSIYISDREYERIYKLDENNKPVRLTEENNLKEIIAYKNYLKKNALSSGKNLEETKVNVPYQNVMLIKNDYANILLGVEFPKVQNEEANFENLDTTINNLFDSKKMQSNLDVTIDGSRLSFYVTDKKDKEAVYNIFLNADTTLGKSEDGKTLAEEIITFNVRVVSGNDSNKQFSIKKGNKQIKIIALRDNEQNVKYFAVDNKIIFNNRLKQNYSASEIRNSILQEAGNKSSNVVTEISNKEAVELIKDLVKSTKMHQNQEFNIGDAIVEVDKTNSVDDFRTRARVFNELTVYPVKKSIDAGKKRKPSTSPKSTIKRKPINEGDTATLDNQKTFDTSEHEQAAQAAPAIAKKIKNGEEVNLPIEVIDDVLSLLDDIAKKDLGVSFEGTVKSRAENAKIIQDWQNKRKVDQGIEVEETETPTNEEVGKPLGQSFDDDPTAGDAPFTFNEYGVIETREDAATRLSQIIDLPVVRIDNIVRGGNALGVFYNGVIGLRDRVGQSVKYHEAFHAVYRMYLSDAEIASYLQIAKNKYDAPTAKELTDLRNAINAEHTQPLDLSEQELIDLFYEEKMADEFASYAVKKDNAKGLAKLFNMLIDLINSLLGNDFTKLQKAIYDGQFKSAIQKSNTLLRNIPAFKIFSKRTEDDYIFTNNKITTTVINSVADRILNSNLTIFDDNTFNTAYEKVMADINPQNYAEDVNQLSIYAAETTYNNIKEVFEANMQELKSEVKTVLSLYSIQEVESLDKKADDNESDFSRFQRSIWETGGWGTTSKRVKSYFGFTKVYTDLYNLGLPNKPEYYLNADPIAIYQFLERNLADESYTTIFKKLKDIAKIDDSTQELWNNIVKDAAGETGLEQEAVIEALVSGNYELLIDSPLVNDLINSLYKVKGNFFISQLNKQTKETEFFNSNQNGADKTIVQQWASAYSNLIFPNENKQEYINNILDQINESFIIDIASDYTTQVNEKSDEIYNLFKQIGITISKDYIKWNLIHVNELDYLRDFYAAYSNAEPLSSIGGNDLIKTIKRYVRNDFNPEDSLGIFSTKTVKGEDDSIISIFRKLASNNLLFDKTITESTFTNGENKQIYDKIYPSYLFETINSFKKLTKDQIAELQKIVKNNNVDDFKKFYSDVLNRTLDTYELTMAMDMFATNPMFQGDPHRLQFIFSNMEHAIHDAFKEKDTENLFKKANVAKSFKRLDNVTTELFTMTAYSKTRPLQYVNEEGDIETITFGWVYMGQNEGKATTVSVLMPIEEGIANLEEGSVINTINEMLNHEVKSIKKVKKQIEEINKEGLNSFTSDGTKKYSEEFHGKIQDGAINVETARGLKMFNFPSIFEELADLPDAYTLDTPLSNGNTVKQELESFIDNEFLEYRRFLESTELLTADNKSDFIPGYFREQGKVSDTKLREYFLNDYLNTFKFSLALHGNFAANFKNVGAVTKRNARLIANGPSMRGKSYNYAILKSKEEIISAFESLRTGIDKGVVGTEDQKEIDSTDAQTLSTATFTIEFLQSMGKVPTEVKDLLTKIERGLDLIEPLTEKELSILEKNNATLQPKKIVQGDMFSYLKTSMHTLTLSQVAELNPNLKGDEMAFSTINRAFSNKNYNQIFDELFVPKAGKEELFFLLQEMYNTGSQFVAFDSAIKTFKGNVNNNLELNAYSDSSIDVSNFYIEHVQEMDGHTIREQVNTDGFKEEVVHGVQVQHLIWSEQDESMMSYFMNNEVKMDKLVEAYEGLLAKRIKNGLEEDLMPKIFQIAKNGKLTKAKWDDLMQYMKSSIAGTSDDPYLNILFSEIENSEPNFSLDFPVIQRKFQALYLRYISKKALSFKTKGNKYTLVSDYGVKINRFAKKIANSASELDLSKIDDKELSTYIEDSSGIYQVTNEENATHTLPHRLRHRVWDSELNLYVSEVIVSERVLQKLNLKKGDTIRPELLIQLGLRIPTQDKHSMMVLKIVGTEPGYMGNMIQAPYEIVKLSGADFDVDALYARAFDFFQDNEGNQIIYGDYLQSDTPIKTAYKEMVMSNHNSQKDNQDYALLFEKFKENSDSKASMYQVIEDFYQTQGGPSLVEFETLDAYKTKRNRITKNVKDTKSNKIKNINPITIEENNNLLLRVELNFINNDGNKQIAATPASMETIKKVNDKIEERLGVSESANNTISKHNKTNTKEAIQTGQDNIGPAALFNTLFQLLVKDKVNTESYFGKQDFSSLVNDDDVRINDMVSEIISSMTDNANEQDAEKYNLTLQTVTPVLVMLGIGINTEKVLLLSKQPAIKFLIKKYAQYQSPLENDTKTEMRKYIKDPKLLLDYLMYEFKKENNVYSEAEIESYKASNQIPAYKIKNVKNPTEEELLVNLEEDFDLGFQENTLQEFVRLMDYSTQIISASRLISLTKGLKSSFSEITLEEDLKNLNLTVEGTGNKVKNYNVVTLENKKPSGFAPMLTDTLLETKVIAAHIMLKNSDSFFINQSDFYKDIVEEISKALKPGTLNYDDTKFDISEMIISRLMTFINGKGQIDPSILFNDSDIDVVINDLKVRFPDNKFLQNIYVEEIKFEKTTGNVIKDVRVNSWTSNNPSFVAEMLSGFEDLYYRLRQEKDSELSKNRFEGVTKLLRYLVAKNGLAFKNGSYIKFISPLKFNFYHNRLNKLRVAMSKLNYSEKQIEEILGMSMAQFKYETAYIYNVNNQNTFSLKYNNKPISKANNTVSRDNSKSKKRINIDMSYGIKFTKQKDETQEDKNKRIAEGFVKNQENIFTYTKITTTEDSNNRKKLNNPVVFKDNNKTLFALNRTAEYIMSEKNPYYIVRDFETGKQYNYTAKRDSALPTSVESIVEKGTLIKEGKLDYKMTSDISEFKEIDSFSYGNTIVPAAWSVSEVKKWSVRQEKVETSTVTVLNNETTKSKEIGGALGQSMDEFLLSGGESVDKKPTIQTDEVGKVSNKQKLKLRMKLIALARENRLPAEYSKFEDPVEQALEALPEVINIFEKEGLQAVEAWLENCK